MVSVGGICLRGSVKIFLCCLLVISRIDVFAHGLTTEPKIEFVENAGQWEDNVLYKADLSGGWLFLEQNQLTYLFLETPDHHHRASPETETNTRSKSHVDHDPAKINGHAYRTKWLGANTVTEIYTEQSYPHQQNYFLGNDQQKWKSGVKSWKNVVYKEVYDHIDFNIRWDGQYKGVDAPTDGYILL